MSRCRERDLNRREFLRVTSLAAAGITLVGFGAGCGDDGSSSTGGEGSKDNSGDGSSLTIMTWAGYDTPELRGPWDAEHPDVKLNFVFANEDAEFFAKLQSGFETDTLEPVWTKVYVDAGLVQPIDTAKLTNWSGIPATFTDLGAFGGEQYFVPFNWGYSGILCRTDKIAQPTSYGDLWSPEYTGKISCFDSGEVVFAMSCLALGIDPSETTEEQKSAISDKMVEFAKQCQSYWVDATQADTEFAAGNFPVMAGAWPASYVAALGSGLEVTYGGNEEGLLGWVGQMAVAATTKNYDLALEYIDARLSVEAQSYCANTWGYGVVNWDAVPMLNDDVIELFNLGDQAALDKVIFLPPVDDRLRTLYTDLWADAKAQAAG